jgi:hypothetical protein
MDPFPRENPEYGRTGTVVDSGEEPDDLARLVAIAQSNDQLSALLDVVNKRLRAVRAYLAEAGGESGLGRACYRHWKTKHSGILLLLRANRLEARLLLARLDPDLLEQGPTCFASPGRRPPSRADPRPDGRFDPLQIVPLGVVPGMSRRGHSEIQPDSP